MSPPPLRLLLLRLAECPVSQRRRLTHRQQVRQAGPGQAPKPMTSLCAGSGTNNSVLHLTPAPVVCSQPVSRVDRRLRSMVDTDSELSRRQVPTSGRSAPAAALVTVPAPAAGLMCSVDRRLVRRELLTWAKKIPVVVGTSNNRPPVKPSHT